MSNSSNKEIASVGITIVLYVISVTICHTTWTCPCVRLNIGTLAICCMSAVSEVIRSATAV
eukprot:1577068-Prorocentrum_lima.AAC.1